MNSPTAAALGLTLALALILGAAAQTAPATNGTAAAVAHGGSSRWRCRSGWGYCNGRCCNYQSDWTSCGRVSAKAQCERASTHRWRALDAPAPGVPYQGGGASSSIHTPTPPTRSHPTQGRVQTHPLTTPIPPTPACARSVATVVPLEGALVAGARGVRIAPPRAITAAGWPRTLQPTRT